MNLKNYALDNDAVSPVLGELMMIVLALLLVSLFSVTLLGLLPSERSDTVDILMGNSLDNITLQHKGGDWVRKSDLQIVIIKDKQTTTIRSSDDFLSLREIHLILVTKSLFSHLISNLMEEKPFVW